MDIDLTRYAKEEVYLLKWGAMPINIFLESKDNEEVSSKEYLERIETLFRGAEQIVQNWEKVRFSTDEADDLVTVRNEIDKELYAYFFNFFYKLRILIPQNFLEEDYFYNVSNKKKENNDFIMDVFYDGFVYLGFKKIDLLKESISSMGVGVRETLGELLRKLGKTIHCSPNPLREEFLLVRTNKRLPRGIDYFKFYNASTRIICFIPSRKEFSAYEFIKFLYMENSFNLNVFYNARKIADKLFLGQESILELRSSIFELLASERKYSIKNIERYCSKIYLHINRFMENNLDFIESKERFLGILKENSFLISNEKMYKEELNLSLIDFAELHQHMEYINEVINRRSRVKQWAITIITSIITSLITLFLGGKLLA